jgi:hypothetical protein
MISAKKIRPAGITLLAIVFLWWSAWNGLRLFEAIYFWNALEEYGTSSLYVVVSGGFWLFSGLFIVWGIWQRKAWGRSAAILGIVVYSAWYWVDRLVVQKPHANWPFTLIVNLIFLILILVILNTRKIRHSFQRDGYERKPENSSTT